MSDWDDINADGTITISKEERKDELTRERDVINHTKTFHNRSIYINEDAAEVLDRIRESGNGDEWIFSFNGKRLTCRNLSYVLEKYARENGVGVKATHALRRTFGSDLYADGASSLECSQVLGNTPEIFERHYLFNTKSKAETKIHINNLKLRNKAV